MWAALAHAEQQAVLLADTAIVRAGETLMDIARTHDLGFVELRSANPDLDPWLPAAGTAVRLPTAHLPPPQLRQAPLVINVAAMRLYWRAADGTVVSFPVGIGRDGMALSPATTRVVSKRRAPVWVPPPSVLAEKPWLPAQVPPGPDNPLGAFSLDLAIGLVRIHGTNLPDGVGRRVSHGCFRLYPEDIERLFPQVPIGTSVAIIDMPIMVAQADGQWWLEIHAGQEAADAIEAGKPSPVPTRPGLERQIAEAVGSESWRIDWGAVAWARDHPFGVPVRISHQGAPPPLTLKRSEEPPP